MSGDCELHGCPFCQDEREQKPWIDPCQTCVQLRDAAFDALVSLNPRWQCELEDCIHCSGCDLCSKGGGVCRDCRLCKSCQTPDMLELDECWTGSVWSKVRQEEIPVYTHSYRDPKTGRWK